MNAALHQASRILGLDEDPPVGFIQHRNGARTRAVLATPADTVHRFSAAAGRVLIKFYKGDGTSRGSREYQMYHQDHFRCIEALTGNVLVQQSLEGGVFPGVGPYALLSYLEGEELAPVLERHRLSPEQAGTILRDISLGLWLPLWSAGLRFKDCHPGNFVLTPAGRTAMIDTEQMRKDARELLLAPETWSQRDLHEASGIARLPRLVQKVVLAANPALAGAGVLRVVKTALDETGVPEHLSRLGRAQGATGAAEAALEQFLIRLQDEGWIQ